MTIFGNGKDEVQEIKKQVVVSNGKLKDLENEIKVLRRQVEFLKDLCKRNEEMIIGEISNKTRYL